MITAPMVIEIYEAGGSTALGAIKSVISCEIEEAINEIGAFSFSVPSGDPSAALLTVAREVSIIREDEGEIFRGIIDAVEPQNRDDSWVIDVRGQSLAEELTWLNTLRRIPIDNETVGDALDIMLDGSGWTGTATGTFSNLIESKAFAYQTRFHAAREIAQMALAYVRETATPRELEIKNTSASTGIRLKQPSQLTPQALASSDIGIVERVNKIGMDGQIYNRISPFIKIDTHDYVDLGMSDRASPYAISNRIPGRPTITAIATYSGTTDQLNQHINNNTSTQHLIEIESRGYDRAIVLVFMVGGTSGGGFSTPGSVYFNGVRALFTVQIGNIDVATAGTNRWIAGNVYRAPAGVNRLTWTFGSGTSASYTAIAIALEGVDLLDPVIESSPPSASGTSNSPSVAIPAPKGALTLNFVRHASTESGTPGSGQEEILDNNNCKVSQRPGDGTTPNMQWTLSSSSQWLSVAANIRGARNYYIEDTTSQQAYGVREYPLSAGTFRPTSEDLTEVSNSLYDFAVDFLQKHKDPVSHYEVSVSALPKGPRDWLVGDTFVLDVQEPESRINIEETLICTRRRHSYNGDGVRSWNLTLSTVARHKQDLIETITSVMGAAKAVQGNQV